MGGIYDCNCIVSGGTSHRSRAFENRALRRIFGHRRDEVTGGWKNCIMRSPIIRSLRQILLG
jgi:hypothetical protein